SAVRCVDETTAPDVEADVAQSGEEDEVAGTERATRDAAPALELRHGVVGQRHAEVPVDERDEARAVEARPRRRAAPAVRHADERPRVASDEHTFLEVVRVPPRRRVRERRNDERESAEKQDGEESKPQHEEIRSACATAHPAAACRRSWLSRTSGAQSRLPRKGGNRPVRTL